VLAYLIDEVNMEYRTLGRPGLRISRLSLGAMTFGAGSGIWGEIAGLDGAQAARLVAVAAGQGITRLVLSGVQRDRLDRASQPEVTYPHWMQQFHDKDRV
jgi:hypothetical protein